MNTDLTIDDICSETHSATVNGHSSDHSTILHPRSNPVTSSGSSFCPSLQRTFDIQSRHEGWAELRIVADLFNRAQLERVAITNIVRPPDQGGNIDGEHFATHLALLQNTEDSAKLMLGRTFKRVVPIELRNFQKANAGIGLHLLARLLGELGDPYIATPHYWQGTGGTNRVLMVEPSRPRTTGQLWQLASHGAPGRRLKGMTADELAAQGNPVLKMIVHLLAESCELAIGSTIVHKSGTTFSRRRSPYRDIYDAIKSDVEDKTHTTECVRCGPSGHPAQIGSPWNPGHQHAHALRLVGKAILKDLWLIRREALTGIPVDQSTTETHCGYVDGNDLAAGVA